MLPEDLEKGAAKARVWDEVYVWVVGNWLLKVDGGKARHADSDAIYKLFYFITLAMTISVGVAVYYERWPWSWVRQLLLTNIQMPQVDFNRVGELQHVKCEELFAVLDWPRGV